MAYLIPPMLFLAYLWLRIQGSREREIVASVTIGASCEVVFDLVSQVDRTPQWRLDSDRLPRALTPMRLSRWGEPVPLSLRAGWGDAQQVQVRSTPGREFAWRHAARRMIRYESIYQLTPGTKGGSCKLTWEIRYRMLRWIDAVRNLWLLEEDTRRSMEASLEAIRETAETVVARPAWYKAAGQRHAIFR